MHPVLFKLGSFTIYTYGFCIALGALLGFTYMYRQGKKQYGLTFDQSNNLFILLVVGGVVGGKFFMIFEDPALYFSQPKKLFSGSGFVFYGSLLTTIPIMLWYFKKVKVPVVGMLDIMAAVTCIVHGFGRVGCFMAGCCYGLPTDSFLSVMFSDPMCQAEPLHTPLYPTQLLEATFISSILIALLILKKRKQFDGQLFLIYLMVYAIGRAVLEMFRGDIERGFLIDNVLSNSQFISILVVSVALYFYIRLNRNKKITTR
ncbi:MAG: prolipoprotein diacylglyceryl transferase [Cyclobacteriaceae bacterium]|nr:prolipoprotein diacylglyceryl transferase [Cyclobacteriaceae bacterium]